MLSLGQAVAFFGVLVSWDALSDPYCASKYLLLAAICLAYAITTQPKYGRLSVLNIIYFMSLVFFAALAFRPVCFIGKKLNYFTGVLPMALVGICYHYSIGACWRKISNSYIIACVLVSLACLAQTYGLLMPQGDYFAGRVYACIGSPVFLSGVMAMAIPLCLGRLYTPFAIPLFVTVILLTQSRSGLVAASVGVLGYCYARGFIGWRSSLLAGLLAVAGSMGLFTGLRNTSKSDLGRYHMTRVAGRAILEYPFGIGPERFGWAMRKYRDAALDRDMGMDWNNSYVHNHIIEALLTGGPAFLVVHVLLLAGIGLFLYRSGNPGVFGAAAALCAFGLMQPTPLIMKAVLACLAGAADSSEKPAPRAGMIALAVMAFAASLSAVTMSKIYQDGLNAGLAQMVLDSYDHMPSAVGEQ